MAFDLVQPAGTFGETYYNSPSFTGTGGNGNSFDAASFNWGGLAQGAGSFFNGLFTGVGNLVGGINNKPNQINPATGAPYPAYNPTAQPATQPLSMTTWVVAAVFIIVIIIVMVLVFKGSKTATA